MKKKVLLVLSVGMLVMLYACSPTNSPKKGKKKQKKKVVTESRVMKIAKDLIKQKGNLNQRYDSRFKKNSKKIPILVWAISQNDVKTVKLLLDKGANPNITVLKRSTDPAIFEAITSVILDPPKSKRYKDRINSSFNICELLIKAGAKVTTSNKIGETALHKAACKGREDICLLLIKKGAKVNAVNRMGTAPLHLAAKYGYWKVVKSLLRKRARINAKNGLQKTPLKLAMERCDEDLHKKCRREIPGAYPGADYNKTIKILKKSGGK